MGLLAPSPCEQATAEQEEREREWLGDTAGGDGAMRRGGREAVCSRRWWSAIAPSHPILGDDGHALLCPRRKSESGQGA